MLRHVALNSSDQHGNIYPRFNQGPEEQLCTLVQLSLIYVTASLALRQSLNW